MAKTDHLLHRRALFYFLFAISGFSGLIYESIWSHYLKLFLGHAAYAQTLVLTIFMGGMAIGAWLASRYTGRWKNLLLAYAVIEGVIGVCALAFHNVFVAATDFAYTSIIPELASPWSVSLLKWVLAGGLILPQSILLGATFPLMSAGLIRRFPQTPGASLAMLYFTNSLGAAIGVLMSGFVLTELVGLPGTLLTAALINILLALLVWALVRNTTEKALPRPAHRAGNGAARLVRLLLIASFATGAASFMYEIGWIRMLSLVLGTSTHAFELMLSAFILGLAFGGLWIRRRIDNLKEPIRFLGVVQIAMGLLALATLVAYNASFDVMQALMDSLARTSGGYRLFNIGSHAIALGIMLPATFCAGMTLPLITQVLMRQHFGEKSIGATYAANTVGAIAGVFFAVHVGLPVTGIKGLITLGAALDMALGLLLLRAAAAHSRSWAVPGAAVFVGAVVIAVILGVELDRYKMASGVYRSGRLYGPGAVEILYHRDGKTATVDLVKHADGAVSIRTNGKPDALINMYGQKTDGGDEATMTLVGVIPLALHPAARTAANIGLGSGLSAHVLLGASGIEHVDTIEIEPAMVEAARGFGARVARTFHDPRSRIYIEDAKTFFANQRSRYDIIVSEPSNPWVSGVASLYTDEFYRRARTHLNPGGLFVQWLQVYEIDTNLVASVMKAIGRNFSDYGVYVANDGDLIIVARPDGRLASPDFSAVAGQAAIAQEMRGIGIATAQDLALRRLGDRALFEPLFAAIPIPVNSDFHPVLDLNATRARFMRSGATDLLALMVAPLPVLEILGHAPLSSDTTRVTAAREFSRTQVVRGAAAARDFYRGRGLAGLQDGALDATLARHLVVVERFARDCRDPLAPALWLDSVFAIASMTFPQLRPHETDVFWRHWRTSDCYSRLSSYQTDSLALFRAVGQRDLAKMARLAESLLMTRADASREQGTYLLAAGMLAHLGQGDGKEALRLWDTYGLPVLDGNSAALMLQLLWTHGVVQARSARNPA